MSSQSDSGNATFAAAHRWIIPEVTHEIAHVPIRAGFDRHAQLAALCRGGEQVALRGHESDVVRYVHVMSPPVESSRQQILQSAPCTLLHHAVMSRGAFASHHILLRRL